MHKCKSIGSKINYVGSSRWKVEKWKFITYYWLEVVQLVQAMHHKSGGSVFDSR